jgi:HEAT repeat protein
MKFFFAAILTVVIFTPIPVRAESIEELIARLSETTTAPDATFKLAAMGNEAVDALKSSLAGKDPCVKYHALWALTLIGDKSAGAAAVKLLADNDPLVRMRAVFAVDKLAPDEVKLLLERLAADTESLVRGCAATVLARHKDPTVTKTLLKSLELHKNRFSAISLISHGKNAAPGLRMHLTSKDPAVRGLACFALGLIGDKESLDSLHKAARDKDPDVAVSAAIALVLMRQDEAFSLLQEALKRRGQSTENIEAIAKKVVLALEAYRKAGKTQKAKFVGDLGKYGLLPPVPDLISELRTSSDSGSRAAATSALGSIGSDLALAALIEASGDREKIVRLATAIALGRIAVREAVAPLRTLSYDPDPEVRAAAATALAKLDIRDLSPIFKRMSEDDESSVRMAALQALDMYPPSFTEPVFISLLKKEKKPEAKALLVRLLGRIGTDNALAVILNKVDSKDLRVKIAAVEALGCFSEQTAAHKLISVLKQDTNEELQITAAQALGRTGSNLGVTVLKGLFSKSNGALKLAVTEALGCSRSTDAAPALVLALLKETDAQLGSTIAKALGKIAQPESLPIIIAVARDEEKPAAMRRASVEALGNFENQEDAKTVALSFLQEDDLAAEAAAALQQLGDSSGLAALKRLLAKPEPDDRLRAVRALKSMPGHEATSLIATATKDKDITVALTASLELLARSKFEGLAILQNLLDQEKTSEKLGEILKEFELVRVLSPVMERLSRAGEPRMKMTLVELLGRLRLRDFRLPRDASLSDYLDAAARWLRWWEATMTKVPSGRSRIRKEEGETEQSREGLEKGLDWLKKKK